MQIQAPVWHSKNISEGNPSPATLPLQTKGTAHQATHSRVTVVCESRFNSKGVGLDVGMKQ